MASYLRFLICLLGRLHASVWPKASSMSSTSTTFRTSWSWRGCCPAWRAAEVVLDVHDSVPETFATKFSGALVLPEGALPGRATERPGGAQGDLRQPSAAGHAGGARDPELEDVHLDERPGSRDFRASADSTDGRRRTATLQSRVPRHDGRAARRGPAHPGRGAAARARPGAAAALWGHGDDLAAFQQSGAGAGRRRDACLFRPKGYPLQELPAPPAARWTSASSAIAAARPAT